MPKATRGFFRALKYAWLALTAEYELAGNIWVNFGKVFITVGIYQMLLEPGSIAI